MERSESFTLFNLEGARSRTRGYSSAGRAPALQAGGQRFDPVYLHHLLSFEKERRQRKLYMTLNLDSSICSDKCLNLTSGQNRTLKTEQSNQSMKSKQQRETNVIVELFDSKRVKQ